MKAKFAGRGSSHNRNNIKMFACLLAATIVSGLSGCTSARVVQQDESSITIAVPENTDTWPNYYTSEADKLAQEKLPGSVKMAAFEKPVGQVVTQTGQQNVGGNGSVSGQSVTVTTDQKETHLIYKLPVLHGKRETLPDLPFPNMSAPKPVTMPGQNIGLAGGTTVSDPKKEVPVPKIGEKSSDGMLPALKFPNQEKPTAVKTVPPLVMPEISPPGSFPTTGMPR